MTGTCESAEFEWQCMRNSEHQLARKERLKVACTAEESSQLSITRKKKKTSYTSFKLSDVICAFATKTSVRLNKET